MRFLAGEKGPSRLPARGLGLAFALSLALSGAATLLVEETRADALFVMTARLPSPRHAMGAAWNGHSVYLFGGFYPYATLSQVARYTPSTNTVSVMGAALSPPRLGASAVFDPYPGPGCPAGCAYLFGGWSGLPPEPFLSEVVRYDPASDTLSSLGNLLPTRRHSTAAAFDPRPDPAGKGVCTKGCAYLFGGYDTVVGEINQIVRYDPATDGVAVMGAKFLTGGRHQASAVWDSVSNVAYVIGGCCGEGDEIVRYDPVNDQAVTIPKAFSPGRFGAGAVFDPTFKPECPLGCAYLFGGATTPSGATVLSTITRYSPPLGTRDMGFSLPSPRLQAAAAWDGAHAYVLGGEDIGSVELDEIDKYAP